MLEDRLGRWGQWGCWFALLFIGCDFRAPIESYTVPKADAVYQSNHIAPPSRMLAALLEGADQQWFFKLVGPVEQVDAHADAFERFLSTVSLRDDGAPPIEWQLPDGWSERAGQQMRYATLVLPDQSEVAVTRFPAGPGSTLLANVNRWRGQMGLPRPWTERQLARNVRQVDTASSAASLVVIDGHWRPSRGGPFVGATAPRRQTGPARPKRPQLTAPPGWEEAAPSSLSVADYLLQQEGREVRITVTPMGPAAADVVANVNRWRGQLGLAPAESEAIQAAVESEGEATFVTLEGPEDEGEHRSAILAAIVSRERGVWFFKLRGDHGLALEQQAAFRKMVRAAEFPDP